VGRPQVFDQDLAGLVLQRFGLRLVRLADYSDKAAP
jgi:hypothetical protein